MGNRSDVGVALHKSIHDKVLKKHSFLSEATVFKHELGTLYYFEDTKWYTECDKDIEALYETLREIEDSLFWIVQVCSEYPDSDLGNIGGWYDNPWNLRKYVVVSLEFDGKDEEEGED
jgi:hypothetical protein